MFPSQCSRELVTPNALSVDSPEGQALSLGGSQSRFLSPEPAVFPGVPWPLEGDLGVDVPNECPLGTQPGPGQPLGPVCLQLACWHI